MLYIANGPEIVELVRRILEHAGVELDYQGVVGGSKGLQRVRLEKPDLVLPDERLPDMSGWSVVEQIKLDSELRDIPVIMLVTRNPFADYVFEVFPDFQIRRPAGLHPAKLMATVRQALNARKS
jgi:CheY-like chemotaxis protein